MKIGLIGLGRMGSNMGRRLLSCGFELGVYDADARQAEALGALGASVAGSIAGLCESRDLLITMLPSDAVLEAVATGDGGLTDAMAAGAIHMISGTHGVGAVERVAAAHAAHNQVLVSCTVLGRPDRALQGKLGLIPAGPAAHVRSIEPVLKALGEEIFQAGENPLSSVAVKIANNLVLGCAIEAMGEGMALVRKYQVEPRLFYEVMTQGLFACIAYQSYGDVIAKQDWGRVGAAATIGLKDAELAQEAADRAQVPLPSVDIWHRHLKAAIERGEGALDWAVMAREQFRRSGLE